jgi:hypothetical protein
MGDPAFVERRFDTPDGKVLARFVRPVLQASGEYRCDWSIGWPDGEELRHAYGIDGVQALILAMRAAHDALIASHTYRAGRLTFLDQADLDLPPAWGKGELYNPKPRG